MKSAMIPNNIDAEKALLGSIVIDASVYTQVGDILHSGDFYRDAHRTIYEAIEYLVSRGESADYLTICDELERKNKLDEVGGASYLTSLINEVPTTNNAESYAQIIEDTSVRRRIILAAGNMAASAQNDPADDALATAEELVFAISQKRNRSSYSLISDVMSKCMTRLDEVSQNKTSIVGVPSGFHDLDKLTKGFRRGALYIIAGRPGMGKTSAMLNMAYYAAKQDKKVGFFSLEMSEEELGYRLISSESGVNNTALQTGWIEKDDWEKVMQVMEDISQSGLIIDDTGGLSIAQIRSRARQMKAKEGLDFIVVDYLQLLTANKQGKRIENRVLELGEISRDLKNLAKELDVPVLAGAQLSRQVENRQIKIPQLSDLRESGSIENDADCVMFIYRDDAYNPETERKGLADLIIAKHRNGPLGEVTLKWFAEQTKFGNLEIVNE
ncbi:MAG TPA: replicative DNA helicase [Ktedonobacteraceae bacterium]|jgi:replicative DNA helicase|nr:replicative DNA helicase [Ktedonobacteraceae bacterium]